MTKPDRSPPRTRDLVGLDKTGRKLYRAVLKENPEIADEASSMNLLFEACRAVDLAETALEDVRRNGISIVDPKNRLCRNPALGAYKDATGITMRAFKMLGLEWQADPATKQPRKKHSPFDLRSK